MIARLIEARRVRRAAKRMVALEAAIERAWQEARPPHATHGDRRAYERALREEMAR